MNAEDKKIKDVVENTEEVKNEEETDISFDDIEAAPEDLGELFNEPPILDLFDDEPSEDDLKFEEMNVDAIEDDINLDNVSLDDPVKVYLREIGRVPLLSTDEEIGVGADHIFLEDLKSKYGYTLDGGDIRAINIENFNAASMKLEIKGRSIHPGDAKDKMINAINVGIDFHNSLPTYLRPEHTTLREGFYHLNDIKGNEEFCELFYIVREHDLNKLNTMLDIARLSVKRINESYKDEICKLTIVQGYRNMKEKIDENKFVVDNIVNIYKEMNIPFVFFPIRGGTDGASLTNRGYPCPNLGTGGGNFHGRFEYLDVDQALTMVEILKRLFK